MTVLRSLGYNRGDDLALVSHPTEFTKVNAYSGGKTKIRQSVRQRSFSYKTASLSRQLLYQDDNERAHLAMFQHSAGHP